jgi:hypothetical protein
MGGNNVNSLSDTIGMSTIAGIGCYSNPSSHTYTLATSSSRRFERTCSTNILRHINRRVLVIRGKHLSFITLSIQGITPHIFPGTI